MDGCDSLSRSIRRDGFIYDVFRRIAVVLCYRTASCIP